MKSKKVQKAYSQELTILDFIEENRNLKAALKEARGIIKEYGMHDEFCDGEPDNKGYILDCNCYIGDFEKQCKKLLDD